MFYPFVFDRHGMGPSREPQPQRFYFYTVATIWYSLYLADMAKGRAENLYSIDFTGLLVLGSTCSCFWSRLSFSELFPLFGYYLEEIYFRSLFQTQVHVRGFSSQRITLLIHFLSVCVWVWMDGCGGVASRARNICWGWVEKAVGI